MTAPHAGSTRSVSKILADLASEPKARVSLGDLLAVLGDRAFGVLMLLLSLPNAVGLGAIPGLSTVFGVPQILVALQMVYGAGRPWLPKALLDRSIAMSDFRSVSIKALPHLERIEKHLRPRYEALASPIAERLLGIVFVVLATIVSLPIPLGNQPPAVAMAVISLGLVERDGVFVAAGLAISVLAVMIALAVVLGGAAVIWLAVQQVFGL